MNVGNARMTYIVKQREMKPGIYLTGTNVPSPGGNTPAPARDECLEALILTGWGKACVRPPVAT
ncbi:hypothetical protein [Oryza sativa Japonica Group]|uniref:DUF1263 domain-containing protein n=1 Tax=Oryza sativa subsp. japonica TaxID=39947 RepID=Q5ZBP4_ORYSJ|nr:hypothetical protein [Oryza sativa Japonica Group]BAD53060.1 hypothetical protein [Oryza sativa Japonica Group]